MKNLKKVIILLFIFTICSIIQSYSQTVNKNNVFINQNFILSLESGISYGFTDYKTSNIEPMIRGSFEYYPIVKNNARLGLKLFGGGVKISASDDRGLIANNDEPNPRNIPLEIYTEIIQVGTILQFGLAFSESFISQFGIGATYMDFSPKDINSVRLLFNQQDKYDKNIISFIIEGGTKIKLSDRFSLNLSIAYYPTSTDYLDDISASKGNDSYLNGIIGVSYSISSDIDSDNDGILDKDDRCPNTPDKVKVDEYGCPLDSDKDGVADYLDHCNDTPMGTSVDINGCPMDSDKDGVADYLDKCSDTPVNAGVDSDGCPKDSDGDGVADYIDKCDNTPPGVKVDSVGCLILPDTTALEQDMFYQFILRGDDTFEPNSAKIIESSKLLLNEIAGYIKSQPSSKWRIEGYMDNQGSQSYLKKLSFDRAKAIQEYFVTQGLQPDQFALFGLGSSSPIANNDSQEGRSTNRRIIIIRENNK